MLKSLSRADLPAGTKIIVVDDASSDYGTDFLAAAYPPDAELIRRDHATGSADLAASDLLKRLVTSNSDVSSFSTPT